MNLTLLQDVFFVAAVSAPVPPVGLAYDAPTGCPTEGEFRAAIETRSGRSSLGRSDAATVLAVTIQPEPNGFGGTLQARRGGESSDERRVHGRSCAEVGEALALVTAIAVSREAREEMGNADPGPADTKGQDAAVAASVPPRTDAETGPYTLHAATRLAPPRSETIQVGAGPLRFDLSRSADLYAGATIGLVPSVLLPRYSLVFSAANFVTTPERDQRIVGLVYQIHADFLGSGTYEAADVRTKITGVAFGIDICQSPHYDSEGWILLLCGEYGGGLLKFETKRRDGEMMRSQNIGFGQVSAVVDLSYNLFRGFSLGARLGGSFTMGDIAAERADGSRIFSSSPWSANAFLGATFRF